MNLAAILALAAGEHARRPALLVDGQVVSHHALERRAAAVAAGLRRLGVRPGDRVVLRLPNGAAFVEALLGVLRAGAVAVPLNVLLAPPEVEARIRLTRPAAVLDDADALPSGRGAPDAVEQEPDDAAVILFTSGTSGRPRGAVLTHGGIAAAATNAASALALGPDDVVLGVAPFAHVLGLSTGLVATLSCGGAVAVETRFDAERTLLHMTATNTTVFLGVPTMCLALCEAAAGAERLPQLRLAHVGGAPLPAELARRFEETFAAPVYEGYGLTEMSGVATTYAVGEPLRAGSVGHPLGATELRIAEPDEEGRGEVQFRGPSVVPGYFEDPGATAEAISADGWLATGDVGRLDDDGYLYLVDRRKEVVIRGGYNVYPREVEEVLYAHPAVLEAAVVGVPHDTLGEEVAALVVRRPGARLTVEELQAWAKARVAAYKYPRIVAFVDELPKGPTGKILKREIDRAALARLV